MRKYILFRYFPLFPYFINQKENKCRTQQMLEAKLAH